MKTIGLGFLTASEFVARRSSTLIDDPAANLDEAYEIEQYIAKLEPFYRDAIESLAKTRDEPLRKEVHTIVTIVARHEESRIGHTLSMYLKQDVDPKFFEIIVLDNHSCNESRDNTSGEVEKFQKANPSISVIYAYKVWQENEFANIGNARAHVFDMALARLHARGKSTHETVLISNDADTVDLNTNYLSAISNEFQVNRVVDALVTTTVMPIAAILKPNIYAALSLWDAIDDVIALHEPRNLMGSSSAYRASIYAAIGGYDPKGKMAGDLETGFMIAAAREWDPCSVIRFTKTKLVTDPRRILESAASRTPIYEMYYKFVSNAEVRDANNAQLLSMIADSLDWELFEEDADTFWRCGGAGMYKWRGDRFDIDFKQAMKKIGAQYDTKGGRLHLINIDQLIQKYADEFDDVPQITHSVRRHLDLDRTQKIKLYYGDISESAIGARGKLADQIAEDLELASHRGDVKQVDHLRGERERFAYKPLSR